MGNSLSDSKGICGFFNLIVKQTKPVFKKPLFTNTWKMCYMICIIFSVGHGCLMWQVRFWIFTPTAFTIDESHNSIHTSIRFPDFLTQLQRYDGLPKTLCEIVGPKNTTSSTEAYDVYLMNNNRKFHFKMFISGVILITKICCHFKFFSLLALAFYYFLF